MNDTGGSIDFTALYFNGALEYKVAVQQLKRIECLYTLLKKHYVEGGQESYMNTLKSLERALRLQKITVCSKRAKFFRKFGLAPDGFY